ncbi:MAG TPA: hypothetical protein VF486_07180 [Actinomycetes bacterium]
MGGFLWYGPTPGTSFAGLARTVTTGGTTTAAPFPISLTHNGVRRDANGAVVQTRPICPYPEVAAYKGHGDPAAASNFACRRPGRTEIGHA